MHPNQIRIYVQRGELLSLRRSNYIGKGTVFAKTGVKLRVPHHEEIPLKEACSKCNYKLDS
jgi:hypothetical protein